MRSFRSSLPQLDGELFLTDSGLETDLIFHGGFDLPEFASFVLLHDAAGTKALRTYFREHAAIARDIGAGFIFESATWRASPDWGEKLGYSPARLAEANRRAIELLVELRGELDDYPKPLVISGAIGPRGDGYHPKELLAADEAQHYHTAQIEALADTAADMVNAMTITHAGEAIGITRAATACGIPVAVSFTVEVDGHLPDGTELGESVKQVDDATGGAPAYYSINCAHPTHFENSLNVGEDWMGRLRGIRANASRKSHTELDQADVLDEGDPRELACQYADLRNRFPQLNVLGGCCGTDSRHVREIALACCH